MKPTIIIYRYWQDFNQTLGACTVLDPQDRPLFSALSLERGWRNNEQSVSCVPLGEYKVVLEWSPRCQKMLWELKDVPNRSECKFHASNFWFQLNGCIALGRATTDINHDGYFDVTSSASTMKAFHKALEGYQEATLIIRGI